MAEVFIIQFSALFHFLDVDGFIRIHIVNFNLVKVVLPVGSVSESNIIIEFPFSDVKLAGLYWRYIYRLRQFSVLILFRTFQKQTLCCDENMKKYF